AEPKGTVTLTETATVARREVQAPVAASRAAPADIDAATYAPELASAQGAIRITDEVRAIARRETAGKPTVVAKAHALYDWVYDHMQYDKTVPGWGLGDIPYCLKVGKGNCTDFHTLFIALARASGIPARWNMGFPLAYGDGTAGGPQEVKGYHCWAEFYAPGAGWVPRVGPRPGGRGTIDLRAAQVRAPGARVARPGAAGGVAHARMAGGHREAGRGAGRGADHAARAGEARQPAASARGLVRAVVHEVRLLGSGRVARIGRA